MKKMLLMAVAFLMTTAMNAQNAEKGFSYAAEVGIGSELELGGTRPVQLQQILRFGFARSEVCP